ncbi:hypothetical protein EC841_1188 [Raoultella ornithinolytica]|uniref:Uncharacterized protein n=1 Tax=Raoultella ornithinolytica TaxID=54291 RepID=A0ABD7Q9K1_RAOOR|nr:hypothetical protein EC841_1188 [Raoultella ornithinolytica]
MRHNRCRALTKKWKRCGRKGDWILFCDEHKFQWLKAVLIGIIAPVATGVIASWAYSWLTATEPALSVNVPGQNAIDQAISKAKMEGAGYNTPSASEVVAKFYVLPTVTSKLDTISSVFSLVLVSPFKPVNADFTFDAGDCRFLGYVTDFNPLSRDAVFSIKTVSCTDNANQSYELDFEDYIHAPQGLLADIKSPTERHLTLSREKDGTYSLPLYTNVLVKFNKPVSALEAIGKVTTRF